MNKLENNAIANFINAANPYKTMIGPCSSHIKSILDGADEDYRRRQEMINNIQLATEQLRSEKQIKEK